ncbi:hypothetical protein E3O28_14215 [Cryobacterium sp. TMT2-14]|nr:hypothetical protein E3O28_14215 [Cryobacterium sp. TMT2-14]
MPRAPAGRRRRPRHPSPGPRSARCLPGPRTVRSGSRPARRETAPRTRSREGPRSRDAQLAGALPRPAPPAEVEHPGRTRPEASTSAASTRRGRARGRCRPR